MVQSTALFLAAACAAAFVVSLKSQWMQLAITMVPTAVMTRLFCAGQLFVRSRAMAHSHAVAMS